MAYREENLGQTIRFLLPSLKLRHQDARGVPEDEVHAFLLERFGGYTAIASNVFGYWKDGNGQESYSEHREFTVAVKRPEEIADLKEFLAHIAARVGEQCLYAQVGGAAIVIYAFKEA